MLKLLGREPDELSEYECTRCGLGFRIGYIDYAQHEEQLSPNYCPVCAM